MKKSLADDVDLKDKQNSFLARIEPVYQAIMSMGSDAILLVRPLAGVVSDANMACSQLLGYSMSELSGMCLSDFMPDLPKSAIKMIGETEKATVDLFTSESVWKHRDGEEIPVKMVMKEIGDPSEDLLIIIASDLRPVHAMKKALTISDSRYNDMVNDSGEGLGIVDTDEVFTFANPAACEIFGLPANKLIGMCLSTFLNPQSVEEIKVQTDIRKSGQKSMYELEINRPDGERRWIIVTATPQYDTSRNFTGTFGIFRDITQRKLAKTKVRESEQRLHEIVELTNDWIWEIDPEWKYIFVSSKVYDILGYSPEEMIGKSPFDFLLPEDAPKIKEGVRGLVHQYRPLNAIINRAKHKDGRLVYLETSGIAVFNDQGKYMGYRGADRDVTLRKLHERELIIAKEKAEESDRLKSSILANMSHEFRTPLNGILGFAEILKEVLQQSEYECMVDNIINSGQRLMSTLNSIIILSQLEGGKVKVTKKSIQLAPCILSVLKSMEIISAEKNVFIKTTGIGSLAANTDEELLKQLLLQIVDNAFKFTHQGGITIETTEIRESGKEWVVIKISDTGIGIDKSYYDLIFQEFRQVSEGFGRKYQGSGIGLTISKKIIDLLDGKITIDSVPNAGSCFSIWLPGERSFPTGKPPLSEIATGFKQESTSPAPEQLPLVLLVEDNIVNKDLTILFLRNICTVDYAPNAAVAIELAKAKQYQAILIDINLGYGMNGIEATREIRHIEGYELTPIIAVTGYTMAEDKEQLYAAGCTYHIAKPFTKKNIQKLVQKSLSGN